MLRSLRYLFGALLLCGASAVCAGPTSEQAKEAFDMWLASVNSGNPDDIQAFEGGQGSQVTNARSNDMCSSTAKSKMSQLWTN